MIMKAITYFVLYLFFFGNVKVESSGKRTPRRLKLPEGSVFIVSAAMTTFLPKDLPMGFGHIIEYELHNPLPKSITFAKAEEASKKKIKRKQSTSHRTPGNIPSVFRRKNTQTSRIRRPRAKKEDSEPFKKMMVNNAKYLVERFGYNSTACVSRLQCEVQTLSSGMSLLEDVLLLLFKENPHHSKENCEGFTNFCPISLLQIVLHSEPIEEASL